MKKKIGYGLICVAGVLLGIIADRNKQYLINGQYIRDHWHFRDKIANQAKIINANKTIIFLAFGQSNSSNYGEGSYTCKNKEIYNYYKGDLFLAKEPLLGADGGACSVWTRVADMLIDSGLYKKVVIVPRGIGQTPVKCWSDGPCKVFLEETLDGLKKDNVKLTHIFWDQGETDNVDGTTKEQYKARLEKVIKIFRDRGIDAPFFTTITSYCSFNNDNYMGIDTGITNAQNEVIAQIKNVKRGPNTDSINLAYYRYDYLHFSEKGLNKLAYEWFKKIKDQKD
ncbi:MAG: sialate O-acetylesterase [Bacteroidota bacterium]